jgi:lysosomal acid lipase/cholesteryl ester hydrolase
MPVMGNHEPGGSSVTNILHYTRMVASGEFSYHDYGSKKANMKHYNQSSAPLYNTSHIAETFTKFPSFLLAGNNDALVSKHDLEKLRQIVEPSGTRIETIDTFAHLDYVWGKEAKEKVFKPALEFIKEHTNTTRL